MESRLKRRSLLAATAALPFAERVLADDWPAKPVRMVCPFTPGGSQDSIARRLSSKLGEQFGQSFVIDNRSGAGGSIAADNVAKSPPDGYSVLLGNIGSHALVPHLYAKPPYDPLKDFETAAWIGTQPNLLVCHPAFPHDTLGKLIAAAKAEPGKYSYGCSGLSTSPALAMELLKQKTGVEIVSISYRGASASSADVVAGHVPMCIANIDSLTSQVKAGKLKAIATTGAQRAPAVPEIPTFVDQGFPTWWSPHGRCGRYRQARRRRSRTSCAPAPNAHSRNPTWWRACGWAASSRASCRSPRPISSSRPSTRAGAR